MQNEVRHRQVEDALPASVGDRELHPTSCRTAWEIAPLDGALGIDPRLGLRDEDALVGGHVDERRAIQAE